MQLSFEKLDSESFECECCGTCFSDGFSIYANKERIFHSYSDGHMYSTCTEDTILNVVINYWKIEKLSGIELEFTEEKRLDWNKQYPGNSIAATKENWNEYKKSQILYFEDITKEIFEKCSVLPYDPLLQLKMIVIWIQDLTDEVISVKVV